MERAFAPDTAAEGFPRVCPSSGQCAAVTVILYETLGGEMVSASVDGLSHWFNRITLTDGVFDYDVTGDQFGRPTVQLAPANSLYPGTKLRSSDELTNETIQRARRLAGRYASASVQAIA